MLTPSLSLLRKRTCHGAGIHRSEIAIAAEGDPLDLFTPGYDSEHTASQEEQKVPVKVEGAIRLIVTLSESTRCPLFRLSDRSDHTLDVDESTLPFYRPHDE
jgi:hypothetical protein